MMHTADAIYQQLSATLVEVTQLLETQKECLTDTVASAVAAGEDPISIYKLTDGSGQSSLTPLLLAKAQILSGMAALKASDVASKGARR